jgi:N-acetylmuramoyl-L-alanine amidase-like protein
VVDALQVLIARYAPASRERITALPISSLRPVLAAAIGLALAAAPAPARPHIVSSPIPFPPRRVAEMRRYARRHYGLNTARLRSPHVIVEHVTANSSYRATFNTFAPDVPDPELHELPGTCAHFVIDRDGTIHQLVALRLMCRHTVGLNWTAIGIEHVGLSDAQVMGDARQLRASLRLTRWLQARFGIATRNVIGHNESLSSPYHHERVRRLRSQTHGDMAHRTMVRYRKLLRDAGLRPRP